MIPVQLSDVLARLDLSNGCGGPLRHLGRRTQRPGPTWTTFWARWITSNPKPRAIERIDELRSRIEILMDEIAINLGIEPPAF